MITKITKYALIAGLITTTSTQALPFNLATFTGSKTRIAATAAGSYLFIELVRGLMGKELFIQKAFNKCFGTKTKEAPKNNEVIDLTNEADCDEPQVAQSFADLPGVTIALPGTDPQVTTSAQPSVSPVAAARKRQMSQRKAVQMAQQSKRAEVRAAFQKKQLERFAARKAACTRGRCPRKSHCRPCAINR